MTLGDIPAGAAVFLDANTLVYHFISQPDYGAACTSFLERIEGGDVEGWISPHVLAEVSHRLMTIEACSVFGWPYQGIAARLRRHPDNVRQLTRFRDALTEVERLDLRAVAVSERHVMRAADLSRQFALLTNDALVIAAMQSAGLTSLASNDADFDRVPGITRYAPV